MNTKIAIPYSDGLIFRHLGKCTQFKIYTVEDDKVVSSEIIETEAASHEDLALRLVWSGVNGVICGSIGPGMQGALTGAGIAFLAGVEGPADEAVEKLLAGTLAGTSTANCGGHGGCSGHSGGCGGCAHC